MSLSSTLSFSIYTEYSIFRLRRIAVDQRGRSRDGEIRQRVDRSESIHAAGRESDPAGADVPRSVVDAAATSAGIATATATTVAAAATTAADAARDSTATASGSTATVDGTSAAARATPPSATTAAGSAPGAQPPAAASARPTTTAAGRDVADAAATKQTAAVQSQADGGSHAGRQEGRAECQQTAELQEEEPKESGGKPAPSPAARATRVWSRSDRQGRGAVACLLGHIGRRGPCARIGSDRQEQRCRG